LLQRIPGGLRAFRNGWGNSLSTLWKQSLRSLKKGAPPPAFTAEAPVIILARSVSPNRQTKI
jgi:hypothetical protein